MVFTIVNQKPNWLDPLHTLPINKDYDPVPALRAALLDPLFTPLSNHPVQIAAGNTALDADNVFDLLMRSVATDTIDTAAETTMKALYGQGLIHFDANTPLPVNEAFVTQAASIAKLPHPGPRTIYNVPIDVIPAAKLALSGGAAGIETLFASLGFVFAPETLGFSFITAAAFDDFLVWLDAQTQAIASVLSVETRSKLAQVIASDLKSLTESWILRCDDDDANEEYSFARVIVNMLMTYAKLQQQQSATAGTQAEMTVMAFNVSELFLPKTVVLVNIEMHARATPRRIENEWRLIKAALSSPVKIISNKNLSKLTALPRARARAAAAAANAASNKQAPHGRSAAVQFRKQPPTTVNILNGLLRALRRMKEVNRSQNSFKMRTTTFGRASRRDPDDYNLPGRTTHVHYKPDLHIYLDCSGSISEENYQAAVIMLIKVAKKLNVNLYFTSFSHVLSQDVMLRTAGKSTKAIWEEFRRIPKVGGGTEFEQIWRHINESPKRKARLSLVITDFGWTPRTQRTPHPKNLFYAPVSNMNWDAILMYAKTFQENMVHIEPAIAQRMIGMIR